MQFRPRIDKGIAVLLWAAALICYFLAAAVFFTDLHAAAQALFAIVLAAGGICVHTAVAGTVYVIEGKHLRIRSGILIRKTIPLDRIVRVTPVVSWEASAALSKRRLRIYDDRHGYWDISPEHADEFLRKLKEAAPHVRVESA